MSYNEDLLDAVILTVGADEEFIASLARATATRAWSTTPFHLEHYISASRRPAIAPRIKAAAACLAFVDYDHSLDEAIETTRYLVQAFPGKVIVIAIAETPQSNEILSAMRAGCSEFVLKSFDRQTMDSVFDRLENLHLAAEEHVAERGAIHAILGAKGGVGATTLAVHLGVYLAGQHGKRTLLIDQHVELGHACVYLGMDGSQHHLSEVVRNLNRMDSELLRGFVAKHKSGLDVLSSPDSHTAGPFQADEIAATLEFLRYEYDFILIDCDRAQPELNPAVMDLTTQFYLVGTPEIASIRDLSRTVDKLLVVENAADKVRVVINRFDTQYAISLEQIERAMKLPVELTIASHFPEFVRAANIGEPLTPGSSEAAAALARWADTVAGASAPRTAQRSDRKRLSLWRQTLPAW